METVLELRNLKKRYPKFCLKDVSFQVKQGEIMGFIGRNGAGKTTTLKSILNLVHPDGGEIRFFGLDFLQHESEIKQRLGYAAGGTSYYPRKKIRDVAAMTREFYVNWDEEVYRKYLARFSLDEDKRLIDLSEGMKVKFHLALALSHHAELLILDEPTSGLDPVSREELLEIFLDTAEQGVAILFSTHITQDLEKCADAITYIRDGRLAASMPAEEFRDAYRIVEDSPALTAEQQALVLGRCREKSGGTLLISRKDAEAFPDRELRTADLETIIVHLEKGVAL